jgi:hypothetical protein
MTAKFKLKKEDLKKIISFKSTVVTNVESIAELAEKALWVLNDDTISLRSYGATARGKTALASYTVDVSDVTKSASQIWWSMPINQFTTAAEKITDDEVVIIVDVNASKVSFEGADGTKTSLTLIDKPDEDTMKERLDEIDNLVSKAALKDKLHITEDVTKAMTAIGAVVKISSASDAFQFEKRAIKTADSVHVLSVSSDKDMIDAEGPVMMSTGATALLDKLVKYGDFDIEIYEDGPATINVINLVTAPVRVAWTNANFKFEFPTDDELKSVIPLDTKKTIVKVKVADLNAALDKFDGMFQSAKWRWSQVWVGKDPAKTDEFKMHYEDLATEVFTNLKVELVSDTDPVKHEIFIPTNYLKAITKIAKVDEVIIGFNSLGAQEEHGMGVEIEGGSVKAVVCKLVSAA